MSREARPPDQRGDLGAGPAGGDDLVWARPVWSEVTMPEGPPSERDAAGRRSVPAAGQRSPRLRPSVAHVPIEPGRSALAPRFAPGLVASPRPVPRVRRGRLVVVAIGVVVVLIVSMAITRQVIESMDARSPASASLPSNTLAPLIVTRNPHADPTSSTTAKPNVDLLLLKGRPKPYRAIDPALCDHALTGSALTVTDFGPWNEHPPAAAPLTEEQVRAEITTVMRRRFRNDDPDRAVADALALFDSDAIQKLAGPEISLRGALVEMKGTIGEPALAFVLSTDRPLTMHFGPTQSKGTEGQTYGDGYQLDITMSERTRYERPALMAPIVFHELLHQNGAAYQDEELTNNALDTRMMIETLRDYPEGIAAPTELASATRISVLAQLNTRVGPQMTLARSDAATVFPRTSGPVQPKTFEEYVLAPAPGSEKNPYASLPRSPTPGHLTLTQVLASMTDDATAPSPAQFDETTLDFIDRHPGVDNCSQLVAAQALGILHDGSAAQQAARRYLAELPK